MLAGLIACGVLLFTRSRGPSMRDGAERDDALLHELTDWPTEGGPEVAFGNPIAGDESAPQRQAVPLEAVAVFPPPVTAPEAPEAPEAPTGFDGP